MGRGRVSHPPRLCQICEQEFTPEDARRTICYKEACVTARSQGYNQKKMEKRRVLKETGAWKTHAKKVAGTGRGRKGKPHENIRRCLGWCGKDFSVPPGTDVHFCLTCERRRADRIENLDESALGIGVSELGDIIETDRAWKRPRFLLTG